MNDKSCNEFNDINIVDFYDYFKIVNVNEYDLDIELDYFFFNDKCEDIFCNFLFNDLVIVVEIFEVVKIIKNNKLLGLDIVVNEYIKLFINIMILLYVKFFNLVFDIGIILEVWLVGNIKLIYKKKGSYVDL